MVSGRAAVFDLKSTNSPNKRMGLGQMGGVPCSSSTREAETLGSRSPGRLDCRLENGYQSSGNPFRTVCLNLSMMETGVSDWMTLQIFGVGTIKVDGKWNLESRREGG